MFSLGILFYFLQEPIDEPEQLLYDADDESPANERAAGLANERAAGRKLLQNYPAVPSYFTFVNFTNCVYLYTQNITLSVEGYDPWLLSSPTIDPSSYCINYTAESVHCLQAGGAGCLLTAVVPILFGYLSVAS